MATPDAGHFIITPGANKLVKVALLFQEGEHQTSIGGPVTPVANSYKNNAIILTGWGMIVPPIGAYFSSKVVAYGLTFTTTPVVVANFLGWTNSGVASINAFGASTDSDKTGVAYAGSLGQTQFTVVVHKLNQGTLTSSFLNGTNSWFGFSWIAIGIL